MGRWSARLAPSFLRFAEVQDGQNVLDVGCGTGILSRALVSFEASVKITGIDPVQDYVSFAREAVSTRRAQFEVGVAESLPFADGAFMRRSLFSCRRTSGTRGKRSARWRELPGQAVSSRHVNGTFKTACQRSHCSDRQLKRWPQLPCFRRSGLADLG
jgi:SAM-dependent methyltransferase